MVAQVFRVDLIISVIWNQCCTAIIDNQVLEYDASLLVSSRVDQPTPCCFPQHRSISFFALNISRCQQYSRLGSYHLKCNHIVLVCFVCGKYLLHWHMSYRLCVASWGWAEELHIRKHISAEEQDAYGLAGWYAMEWSLISRIATIAAGVRTCTTYAVTVKMQVLVATRL